jgi:hypothetical protein
MDAMFGFFAEDKENCVEGRVVAKQASVPAVERPRKKERRKKVSRRAAPRVGYRAIRQSVVR